MRRSSVQAMLAGGVCAVVLITFYFSVHLHAASPALQRRGAASELQSRVEEETPSTSGVPDTGAATSNGLVFGVLTGVDFHSSRVPHLLATWARRIGRADMVFYSDTPDPSIPTVLLQPPADERMLAGGAWRNFPGLMHLHDNWPRARWFIFVDDDTFVYTSSLETLLARFDSSEAHYLGLYHTPRVDLEWKEVHLAYASGGAGYILSAGALSKLRPRLDACHEEYTGWAGDIRVGKCLLDVGVRIEGLEGFHHEVPEKYTWTDAGTKHISNEATAERQPPITFHHNSAESMRRLATASEVWAVAADPKSPARRHVWSWDFSALAFHEFDAVDGGQSVRLLFGNRIDKMLGVYHLTPAPQRRWHTQYDKLLGFHASPSAVAAAASGSADGSSSSSTAAATTATDNASWSFEMALSITLDLSSFPFRRDSCDAGAGSGGAARRKRALVRIYCGNQCPDGGGGDTARSVQAGSVRGLIGGGEGGEDGEQGGKGGSLPPGNLCSVYEQEPHCVLVLNIALAHCPQPILRTQRLLGVSTGGASSFSRLRSAAEIGRLAPAPPEDVVRLGAPTPRWAPGCEGDACARAVRTRSLQTFTISSRAGGEWLGRPRVEISPAGILDHVEVGGALWEANRTWVDPITPAELRLTTSCVAAPEGGYVDTALADGYRARVQVHVEVAGGTYESLVWEYLRVCAH